MCDIDQTIKEHIAWNAGYSAGQQDAHRFYHMMLTGKQESAEAGGKVKQLQDRLGQYSDDGYSLEQYPNGMVVIWYKGVTIGLLPEAAATPETLQEIIKCHKERLQEPTEVSQ
jgi:hypothetical protein